MFGLFTNKKFRIECPVCGDTYTVKINPSRIEDFDYEFLPDAAFVRKEKCKFCKKEITIVFFKNGKKLEACDESWVEFEQKHRLQTDRIEEDLKKLHRLLKADKNSQKLGKIVSQLESELEQLKASYDKNYNICERKKESWKDKRSKHDERIQKSKLVKK